jgi:hypothetical protein
MTDLPQTSDLGQRVTVEPLIVSLKRKCQEENEAQMSKPLKPGIDFTEEQEQVRLLIYKLKCTFFSVSFLPGAT